MEQYNLNNDSLFLIINMNKNKDVILQKYVNKMKMESLKVLSYMQDFLDNFIISA